MRLNTSCAAIFLLASALCPLTLLSAQANVATNEFPAMALPMHSTTASSVVNPRATPPPAGLAPFSRFAVAAGISPLGINIQGTVNVDRFMNVRAIGNIFNYSLSSINVSGFNVDGNINLATAGASLDVYPWPKHGFRISPGTLFYNKNGVSATMVATGGTSFTLNNYTYYSSPSNPVTGGGGVNLHARNAAPTITVGWGNLISRTGRHWSVPFEVGAAMIGDPVPTIAFTGGQVCSNPQGTANCQNVVGNSDLNTNLQAQLVKYQNDLQPLRFYPIVSVGVGYSFPLRRQSALTAR